MSLIRNEQYKLTASYVNSVAVAFVAVGGLAPLVALATQTLTGEDRVLITILVAGCVTISVALHYMARRILEGMKDD